MEDQIKLARLVRKIKKNDYTGLLNLSRKGLTTDELKVLIEAIKPLTNITSLYLYENFLDKLPEEIGQLTNLRTLSLWGNQLQQLPKEIGQLKRLTRLELSDNLLQELPKEIGQLKRLKYLDAGDNQLQQLPVEISELKRLSHLEVDHNQLQELPEGIGKLTHLTYLQLNNNQLKEIPAELANLTRLTYLNLYSNQIRQIPIEIAQLPRLIELDLDGNKPKDLPGENEVLVSKFNDRYTEQNVVKEEDKQEITIQEENLTECCEICYQNDCFDPATNTCSRCDDMELIDNVIDNDVVNDKLEALESAFSLSAQPGEATRVNKQTSSFIVTQDTYEIRKQLLDSREQILDQREQIIKQQERIVSQRQKAFEREENVLEEKPYKEEKNNGVWSTSTDPYGKWYKRVIALVIFIVVVLVLVFDEYQRNNKERELILDVNPSTKVNKEVPFIVELNSDPEKVEENPVVVLSFGNITILDLEEQPKRVFVGHEELLGITKSPTNPKRFYLRAKRPLVKSNFIIETKSTTITVFVHIIENTTVGSFNGQVLVGSYMKQNS